MANVERKDVDKSKLKDVAVIWVMGEEDKKLENVSLHDFTHIFSLQGGPGSGKGTQCENVQVKYGFTHLSTGDLIRAEVMAGSNRGSQLYKLVSGGDSCLRTYFA